MTTQTIVAVIVLALALLVTGLLVKARALGPLTSAGFALGAAATGSVFVLLG